MFSKYTTKILLKLANVLELWAESIFKKFDNQEQHDAIGSSELSSNMERNPDWSDRKSVDAEINKQVLQNNTNAVEHEWCLQDEELHNVVEHSEKIVTESMIASHPEQNFKNKSGKQSEKHSSVYFNQETVVNSEINSKSKVEHPDTKCLASSPGHTVVNEIVDDWDELLKSTGATTKQQEPVKEKDKNNDVADIIVTAEKHSQKIFAVKDKLKNSLSEISNDVSNTIEPPASKSSITSFAEKNSAESSSINEKPPVVAETIKTKVQHGERFKDSSVDRMQTSISITAGNYSENHVTQPFINTESHWPSLPGNEKQKKESQIDTSLHRWPELPVETTSTELSLLSTETVQASLAIAREMERIRNLENEQKGMLWNA